ncbi:HDOD domain-containing protein [Ketobacter sp.]|uniref:HDOD domain-containing protein n=1 Tax=Ketobacter sp. TaxID=2083498 RepID=UPI000F2568A2|nr:HDOD domain-containing protein [Ketobacter sp.]RLT96925.1 MAG: HDOD domain-containing protein [Ketobacter sp.]
MTEFDAALLEKINRIQPLNPVMMELLQAIQSENNQASDLESIILSDANTSATILKIANSPFYGMSGRIKSVRDACVLLGFDQLRNIIYATALDQASGHGPHPRWSTQLRSHTLASAVIAGTLAKQLSPPVESGQAYALGLLHELGKQVLLSELPELFEEYMATDSAPDRGQLLSIFSEAGAIIARKWRLPEVFQHCIANALKDRAEADSYPHELKLVRCAHGLAQALNYPSPGDDSQNSFEVCLSEMYPDLDSEALLPQLQEALSGNADLVALQQEVAP